MDWLANMGAMCIGAFVGTSIVRLVWPDVRRSDLEALRREIDVWGARIGKTALNGEERAVEAHGRIDRLEELVSDYGARTVALQSQCAAALSEVRKLRRELGGEDER